MKEVKESSRGQRACFSCLVLGMVLFCTAFIIAGYVNYQHTGVIFQPRYKAAIKKIGVDKFYKEAAVLIEERRAFDKAERAKGND